MLSGCQVWPSIAKEQGSASGDGRQGVLWVEKMKNEEWAGRGKMEDNSEVKVSGRRQVHWKDKRVKIQRKRLCGKNIFSLPSSGENQILNYIII